MTAEHPNQRQILIVEDNPPMSLEPKCRQAEEELRTYRLLDEVELAWAERRSL